MKKFDNDFLEYNSLFNPDRTKIAIIAHNNYNNTIGQINFIVKDKTITLELTDKNIELLKNNENGLIIIDQNYQFTIFPTKTNIDYINNLLKQLI